MRSIIGKSAVVPHIKRVRIIEAVVPIVDGILRHLRSLLFVLLRRGLVEYGLMIFSGAEEKRCPILEKRGWPCATAAWHMRLGTVRVWCRRTFQLSHAKGAKSMKLLWLLFRYCRVKRYTQVSKFEPDAQVSCGTSTKVFYEVSHYWR